jgi:hypothetical protein
MRWLLILPMATLPALVQNDKRVSSIITSWLYNGHQTSAKSRVILRT